MEIFPIAQHLLDWTWTSFFISNGLTPDNSFQEFIAPSGTTRLFVGITDAFSFNGAPGTLDDCSGWLGLIGIRKKSHKNRRAFSA